MLKNNCLRALVTLAVLLVAALAAAAPKGSGTFTVSETLLIAGNEIKAGQYDVKYESNSPEATVTFSLHGKTVLKLAGKVVEGDKKFDASSFVITEDSSGHKIIKGLQFGGKKTSIAFE